MGHGFGHHAHHYHSVGSRHFGKHVCNLLCCTFCCGPILFLVGFGLLISSLTDYRTPHITAYNAAVQTWQNEDTSNLGNYLDFLRFKNVKANMTFVNLPITSKLLPQDTTPDPQINDDDSRILNYNEYVRYETYVEVDLSNYCSAGPPMYGCDTSPLASFNLLLNKTWTGFNVPAFTVQRTSVSRGTNCNDGDYYNDAKSTCDAYSIISNICVKVELDEQGLWHVDGSYGGDGCGIESWDVASYNRLRVYGGVFPADTIYLGLSVRAVKDPRVVFYSEMGAGSSLWFGMTQIEKARWGISLLTIGGLMLFCLCGTCLKLARVDKAQRSCYEHIRPPDQVYVPAAVVPVYQQPVVPVYQQPVGVVYPQPVYQQPYPQAYQPYQQAPPTYQTYPNQQPVIITGPSQ